MLIFKSNFLGRYFLIIVVLLTIVVGMLYALPQFLIAKEVKDDGNAFILSQFTYLHDGGDAYIQYAREVVDGHFPPSDLFFDYKNSNIFPPLPPLLLASLIFLFKDVSVAYIIASFLFSSILFLMFFFLGWLVFEKNKFLSIFMGLVGTLTPIAIHLPHAFLSFDNFSNIILKNFYPAVKTFLPNLFLARIDYPLITHLIYLPAIIMFFVFWHKPKFTTGILTGFLAGLLFYTYFHKWVYWVIVIGLASLYLFIFKRSNKQILLKWMILIGTMLLVSIPYFINYLRYNSLLGAQDQILRLQLEIGRNFNWLYWQYYLAYLIFGILVYIVLWKREEFKNRAILYWIFLLAAFLVWNVQFVTGYVPHSDHWPRASSPLLFLILSDLIYILLKKIGLRWINLKAYMFVFLFTLSALLLTKKIINFTGFISSPPQILKDYSFPEDVVSSWGWMNYNLKESSVASSSFISSTYLPAFTSTRPFLPVGIMVPITNYQMEEKFLEVNKLFDVDNNTLDYRLRDGQGLRCYEFCDRPYVGSNIDGSSYFIYGLYFIENKESYSYKTPTAKIVELNERYKNIIVDLEKLNIDYVYYGPWERQFSNISFSNKNNLRLVYKNSLVELYQVK